MVFSFIKMKKGSCDKTLQRHKNFRRFVYKISNVFCVTPWYDFEKEDLKKPILNKLCATVYCLVIGIFLLITRVIDDPDPEENIFDKILSLLSSLISILLTEFLIVGSAFVQGHTWQSFLRKLSSSKCVENCCDCKTIILFYLQFILGHVFYIGSHSYQGYVWYSSLGSKIILTYVSMALPEYYCLLFTLLASNLSLIIKCLYQDLNKFLEKYVEQYFLGVQEGKSEEKVVKCILEVGKQYRYISELVQCYNKIFGWVTLLIFWHSIVQLLRCANLILLIMDDREFSWPIFLSLLGPSMMSMAESAAIILSCEMASSAGEELKHISHKLQENFEVDSTARRELFNLAEIVKSYRPKFTAANFFVIKKSTILRIINITTTYLIVIIECNVKIHEKILRNSK